MSTHVLEANDAVFKLVVEKHRLLDERLNKIEAFLAVPQVDTPTLAEQLEFAKSDPQTRKVLQQTLEELDFENTEIDFI